MKKVKMGIIGCGNISSIYLQNCKNVFEILDLAGVADIDMERANAKAEEYSIKAYTVDEMLADKEIEIILNLTIPNAHYDVCKRALEAGKNVHVEKPLSITREQGAELLALAESKGLLLGAAPDTFMGAGIQTCIKLINDGWIGTPVAATAFMTCHGHEGWHPDPEFYYKVGGGPMFDMGPYYLTALVSMLGPVKRVCGSARKSFDTRTITSEKKRGTIIDVEIPTHIAGVMDFENGAVGTIITSFDVWGANLPCIEIYGSEGSISVPDPNCFGGPVKVKRLKQEGFTEVPLAFGYEENSRGIAVADMAYAIREGRQNRANGKLANHVLEIMHAFHDASASGSYYNLKTSCARPEPLGMALRHGTL